MRENNEKDGVVLDKRKTDDGVSCKALALLASVILVTTVGMVAFTGCISPFEEVGYAAISMEADAGTDELDFDAAVSAGESEAMPYMGDHSALQSAIEANRDVNDELGISPGFSYDRFGYESVYRRSFSGYDAAYDEDGNRILPTDEVVNVRNEAVSSLRTSETGDHSLGALSAGGQSSRNVDGVEFKQVLGGAEGYSILGDGTAVADMSTFAEDVGGVFPHDLSVPEADFDAVNTYTGSLYIFEIDGVGPRANDAGDIVMPVFSDNISLSVRVPDRGRVFGDDDIYIEPDGAFCEEFVFMGASNGLTGDLSTALSSGDRDYLDGVSPYMAVYTNFPMISGDRPISEYKLYLDNFAVNEMRIDSGNANDLSSMFDSEVDSVDVGDVTDVFEPLIDDIASDAAVSANVLSSEVIGTFGSLVSSTVSPASDVLNTGDMGWLEEQVVGGVIGGAESAMERVDRYATYSDDIAQFELIRRMFFEYDMFDIDSISEDDSDEAQALYDALDDLRSSGAVSLSGGGRKWTDYIGTGGFEVTQDPGWGRSSETSSTAEVDYDLGLVAFINRNTGVTSRSEDGICLRDGHSMDVYRHVERFEDDIDSSFWSSDSDDVDNIDFIRPLVVEFYRPVIDSFEDWSDSIDGMDDLLMGDYELDDFFVEFTVSEMIYTDVGDVVTISDDWIYHRTDLDSEMGLNFNGITWGFGIEDDPFDLLGYDIDEMLNESFYDGIEYVEDMLFNMTSDMFEDYPRLVELMGFDPDEPVEDQFDDVEDLGFLQARLFDMIDERDSRIEDLTDEIVDLEEYLNETKEQLAILTEEYRILENMSDDLMDALGDIGFDFGWDADNIFWLTQRTYDPELLGIDFLHDVTVSVPDRIFEEDLVDMDFTDLPGFEDITEGVPINLELHGTSGAIDNSSIVVDILLDGEVEESISVSSDDTVGNRSVYRIPFEYSRDVFGFDQDVTIEASVESVINGNVTEVTDVASVRVVDRNLEDMMGLVDLFKQYFPDTYQQFVDGEFADPLQFFINAFGEGRDFYASEVADYDEGNYRFILRVRDLEVDELLPDEVYSGSPVMSRNINFMETFNMKWGFLYVHGRDYEAEIDVIDPSGDRFTTIDIGRFNFDPETMQEEELGGVGVDGDLADGLNVEIEGDGWFSFGFVAVLDDVTWAWR